MRRSGRLSVITLESSDGMRRRFSSDSLSSESDSEESKKIERLGKRIKEI